MILVSGATGNVGGSLTRQLADTGHPVRGLTRDTARARLPYGVEVAEGDLTRPGSLTDALVGADALFLLSTGQGTEAGVLEAARHAGAGHVAMMSTQAAATHPGTPIGRGSLHAEEAVHASGLPWTVLRPGQFASNTLWWTGQIRDGGTVRAPFADVGLPAIHPGDIAAVARAALTGDGHKGQTYHLTGPEPVTPPEQVRAIGAAIGRDLAFEEISAEQARENMARTMPPAIVDAVLDATGRAVTEASRTPLPTVGEVTGSPARTFQEWAHDNAAAFR